jgi:hypothetical protein
MIHKVSSWLHSVSISFDINVAWYLCFNFKHDMTVASLLNAMKVFNGVQPPYASSVMVELFNVSGQFYVELWYKNDSTREPYQLVVPGKH